MKDIFYFILYFALFLAAAEFLVRLWKFIKQIPSKLRLLWFGIRLLFLKKRTTQSETSLAQYTDTGTQSDFITLNDLAPPTSVKQKSGQQRTQRKRDSKGRFMKN
jgi:hypothetical protein